MTAQLKLKENATTAYQQVLLDEKFRQYVTINTHLGLFRYTRLLFGAAASPAISQQTMDSILNGLNGVGGILDDLIVTGPNDKEHLRNLENTLKRLDSMGVKLKKPKCMFMKPSVEYFAFVVDRHGIHPSPRKVQAIQEVPEPQNARALKSFLGLVNYYRKFIPNMSTVVYPLNRLLMFDAPWAWTETCQVAFKKLKELLLNSPLLANYDLNKPVRLAVDASSYDLGAVSSHVFDDGEEKPIVYASRSLSASEQNYSMIKKEALAIMFGIRKFHQYLFGRRFSLLTDHRLLTLLLGLKRGILVLAASRLQRWAIQLSAYQYDPEYRASQDHANADSLSRLPRKTVEELDVWSIEADQVNHIQMEQTPITVSQIREATPGDPVLSRAMYYILHGWPAEKCIPDELKIYYNKQDEFIVKDGCIIGATRAVIPTKYQAAVLSELHLNHPGMVCMKSLARSHVWWPSIDHDVEQTVRDCLPSESLQESRRRSIILRSGPHILGREYVSTLLVRLMVRCFCL